MLAATKVKVSGSEKSSELEQIQQFLHKTCNQEVSGSFTLQSCKTTEKKYTQKCAASAKQFLCQLDLSFFWLFIFCLSKLSFNAGLSQSSRKETFTSLIIFFKGAKKVSFTACHSRQAVIQLELEPLNAFLTTLLLGNMSHLPPPIPR